MKRFACLAAAISLSACANLQSGPAGDVTAESAIAKYFATIPASALPATSPGKALPGEEAVLTRILVGSCHDEERGDPALAQIAREKADLFLMIGDNVYGDMDGRTYMNNDPDLTELREAFTDLGQQEEFIAARTAHPMMVAWDDHDYGANDAGGDFIFRELAERIHEQFWGLDTMEAGERPGTYYARSFGPDGQRTQIIMLDTRFFRSQLKGTDDYGAPGKERYIPQTASDQQMLGEAQWAWLEEELKKPADLRLLVSSIQIVPNAHGWEAWDKLPAERERLYNLIDETGANGVVAISGDRHTSFLYRKEGATAQPLYELTTSSLNLSFSDETSEMDAAQLGAGYAKTNFGSLAIDWAKNEVALMIHDENGRTVRQATTKFR